MTRSIPEIILELVDINTKELETAQYSIDTARKLFKISKEIKDHAIETFECCY